MIKNNRITLTSVLFLTLVVCLIVMLGLFQFFSTEIIGGLTYRIIIAFICVCIGLLSCLLLNVNPSTRKQCFSINLMMVIFWIAVLIECFITAERYQYSLYETIVAVLPYTFSLLAYALIYIIIHSNKVELRRRVIIVVGVVSFFLALKMIIWVLYNYFNIALFERVLFEYGKSWVRDGKQRINAGYLVGLILAFFSYILSSSKHKCLAFVPIFLILFFLLFINAYRYQFLVAFFSVLLGFWFTNFKKSSTKFLFRVFVLLVGLGTIVYSSYNGIINSFSESSTLGGSTTLRMMTINHYFDVLLLDENSLYTGIGLLVNQNPNSYSILSMSETRLYYLEDIGILGEFFRYGLLSLMIYLPLFIFAIYTLFIAIRKESKYVVFAVVLISYMIFSSFALNIFDYQRCFDFPFYLASLFVINAHLRKKEAFRTERIQTLASKLQ